MKETQLEMLKKERNKLLDAWRTAEDSQKGSILTRITDIDEDLEIYQPEGEKSKCSKYRKNNIQLLQN